MPVDPVVFHPRVNIDGMHELVVVVEEAEDLVEVHGLVVDRRLFDPVHVDGMMPGDHVRVRIDAEPGTAAGADAVSGVRLSDEIRRHLEDSIVVALIADGPDDHARMVAVAFHCLGHQAHVERRQAKIV